MARSRARSSGRARCARHRDPRPARRPRRRDNTGTRVPSTAGGGEEKVLKKLEEVESSLERARENLENLDKVDALERRLLLLGKVAGLIKAASAALGTYFLGSYLDVMPTVVRQLISLALAIAIAVRGHRKGSLAPSGSIAALVVGWATFAHSFSFGVVLLFFFFSSSFLTKLKQDEKEKVEKDFKKNGQRDWIQVLANGGVPTAIALALTFLSVSPAQGAFMRGAFLGYYACCCGDTWSSEIGVLSPRDPVLITTLRTVRRGTNGGVSSWGLLASVLGGTSIGASYYVASLASRDPSVSAAPTAILLCCLAGLVGSLVDSLLGATLQFSGVEEDTMKISNRPGKGIVRISGLQFLNNDAVNFVSAAVMAALTGTAFLITRTM